MKTLFDTATRDFRPLARNSDSETSKEAAAEVLESGKADYQCAWVANWVLKKPGKTSMELAAIAAKSETSRKFLKYNEIFHKRLSLAESRDLIVRGKKRKCLVNETSKLTWWPKN